MLRSPRAPRQPLFPLPCTGSQCFPRANVTNGGWPSMTCRSNSALPVVFARGILWVSFPALTAVCKCALTCVLTGFSGQVVHPRQGSAGLPSTWNRLGTQQVPSTSSVTNERTLWFSEEDSSPLPSLPCPGRILQQLDFHLSPFYFLTPFLCPFLLPLFICNNFIGFLVFSPIQL